MKILFLSNLYPPYNIGGYELICESVNRAMQARGHETRVLTSSHSVDGKGLPPGECGVSRKLRIHGFFGHPWLGIRKLVELELHNNSTLRETVEEFQPDVIHVFNLGGISKSLAHTIERLGIPVVYFVSDHWTTQSLDADVWLDWWNRKPGLSAQGIARAIWNYTGQREKWDAIAPTLPATSVKLRRIYFCSAFLRDKSVAHGRDVAHAEVIHNSVDIDRFQGSPASHDRPCEKLLFVGRLNPEKGIETVLNAMLEVREQFSGSLTVCGRGDAAYEKKLRDFVAAHRLPVTFTGADSAQMPEMYRRHDALIFASEWEEPFALTPLEAMASGLPVISTTTGGSAELFEHGVNALTFTAGSHTDLSRQILALQNEPRLREKIAVAGYEQVRSEFAETAIMDRVESYVRETVESWPAPTKSNLSIEELTYA